MSVETEKQPTEKEHLIALIKQLITGEPSEVQLAELGESLLAALKVTLSGLS